MTITAAELLDQRGGVVPGEGRVHRIMDGHAARLAARKVTPLNMAEADVDERESPPTTAPRNTPFVAPDAKGDLVVSTGATAMPKGHYQRKKKNAAPGEGGEAAAAVPRKPRGGRPKGSGVKARQAKAARPADAATFTIEFIEGEARICVQAGILYAVDARKLAEIATLLEGK